MRRSRRQGYGPCHACGGVLEERLADQPLFVNGRLCLIQSVPLGVCRECGERDAGASVVRRIEAALLFRRRPQRTVRVPVLDYAALPAA